MFSKIVFFFYHLVIFMNYLFISFSILINGHLCVSVDESSMVTFMPPFKLSKVTQ